MIRYLRSANRPEEQEAPRRFRVRDGERNRRTAAHAATHDVRAIDAEMLEQAETLPHVVRPGEMLDAASRLPGLAAIEHDAREVLRQVIEDLDAGVDALRPPLVEGRVEARG